MLEYTSETGILERPPGESQMTNTIVLNNRYELEERLGTGGMAVVYRARDRMLERPVAIKILRENLSHDPEFRERFRQEARSEVRVNLEAWQKEYEERNNWSAPTEITYKHRMNGIAARQKYPEIYDLIDRISEGEVRAAHAIWPEANLPKTEVKTFLLESDSFEISYSVKTNHLYITLGVLRFLQKYAGKILEEDVAFLIAHELGHYVQQQLGIIPQKDSDKKHFEFDADNRAVQILNRAGYSIKGIERIFDYFEKYSELKKQAPQDSREKRVATAKDLLEKLVKADATPEDIASDLFSVRTSFVSLMQEAFKNTPPAKAIQGLIEGNNGWGNHIFFYPRSQLDHLRNAHRQEYLFDD